MGDIIFHESLGAHTKCLRKFTRLLLHLELYKKHITYWHTIPYWKGIFYQWQESYILWNERLPMLTETLPVTVNFYLWQDICSCHKKYLPILQTKFLWHQIISCERKNSSCDNKCLPYTVNFFLYDSLFLLWQEVDCLRRNASQFKKFPVTTNFILQ